MTTGIYSQNLTLYVRTVTCRQTSNKNGYIMMLKKEKWRDEILDEFETTKEKNVWTMMNKYTLPSNKKSIPMKWLLNVKSEYHHHSQLVAMGFHQREGIYFFEDHSPVLNEFTFRLLMMMSMKYDIVVYTLDVVKELLES